MEASKVTSRIFISGSAVFCPRVLETHAGTQLNTMKDGFEILLSSKCFLESFMSFKYW